MVSWREALAKLTGRHVNAIKNPTEKKRRDERKRRKRHRRPRLKGLNLELGFIGFKKQFNILFRKTIFSFFFLPSWRATLLYFNSLVLLSLLCG